MLTIVKTANEYGAISSTSEREGEGEASATYASYQLYVKRIFTFFLHLLLLLLSRKCREVSDALGDCSTRLTKYNGLLRQPVFILFTGAACI